METFSDKVKRLFQEHEELITRKNEPVEGGNGIQVLLSGMVNT